MAKKLRYLIREHKKKDLEISVIKRTGYICKDITKTSMDHVSGEIYTLAFLFMRISIYNSLHESST